MSIKDFEKKLELAKNRAHTWHDGVTYGGGMVMTEQLFGTIDKIDSFYDGDNKEEILLASHLYKAIDRKRLNEATTSALKETGLYDENADFLTAIFNANKDIPSRNSFNAIAMDFSARVAHVVAEVISEPQEDKNLTKTQEWEKKTAWAKELSQEAQVILLAEKLQNFEVSRDKPNPKWEPKRHIEYYESRMIMVEALKDASPALYRECVRVAEEGTRVQRTKQAALLKAQENAGNGI